VGLYVAVAVLCVLLVPISHRRSRSMTRYVVITGAPVVWILLGAASAVSAAVHLASPSTAHGVFAGGLIGTAFVQMVLLRRNLSDDRRGPDGER
jgi:hypothetical protein